jgi:hypothetical protein
MRNRFVTLLVLLLGIMLAGTALAQVQDRPEPAGDELTPPTQHIDFLKPATIVGELVKPAGTYVPAKREAKFPLTIKVRGNFLPEMMRTASHL